MNASFAATAASCGRYPAAVFSSRLQGSDDRFDPTRTRLVGQAARGCGGDRALSRGAEDRPQLVGGPLASGAYARTPGADRGGRQGVLRRLGILFVLAFLAAHRSAQHGCLVLDLPAEPGGLALVDSLVTHGIDLPVILLTPSVAAVAADRTIPAQVVATIEKPFMDQPLVDAIERAFAH